MDETGLWWVLTDGTLRAAKDGDITQIFAANEPTPFYPGSQFYAIHTDAHGNRIFIGHPNVLLRATPVPRMQILQNPGSAFPTHRLGLTSTEETARVEWRLDDGQWQRPPGTTLFIEELPTGQHTLEVRGYNRQFNVGPATKLELDGDPDPVTRTAQLLATLDAPAYDDRAEAVRRLALRGRQAETAIQAALASEKDVNRRWWLQATLQAIADRASPPQ
jgi:hypothetical protein